MVGSYQQGRGVVRSPMCRDALILHQVTPTPLANRPKAMPQRTKARKADGGKCSSPLVDHMAKETTPTLQMNVLLSRNPVSMQLTQFGVALLYVEYIRVLLQVVQPKKRETFLSL